MHNSIIKACENLIENVLGMKPNSITPLNPSGSARKYFRAKVDESSYIVCNSKNLSENRTFIRLDNYLKEKNIPVPFIYGVSPSLDMYLLEDLGHMDLLSVLRSKDESRCKLIRRAIEKLVCFQMLKKSDWENLVEFGPLDSELIRYDLNYVRHNLFDALNLSYNSRELENEFRKLEKILLAYPESNWGLMYRDFQSRNIMVTPDPVFIDFQSARFGPGIYDLVSFAWQAKADFDENEKVLIKNIYIEEYKKNGVDLEEIVNTNIGYWALFRIMQTLGAYGLRGLKEGKRHFIESIPKALSNLKELLQQCDLEQEFKEIYRLVNVLLTEHF